LPLNFTSSPGTHYAGQAESESVRPLLTPIFDDRPILGTVRPSTPTTEELLKRAEDVMRRDQEYLENFNAAVDRLLKQQAEFKAEHPPFGSRYS